MIAVSNNRVYGEITLKYWADPVAYADLDANAVELPAERVLEMVADSIPDILAEDYNGDDVAWRGVEVMTPKPLLLSDRTRRELKARYDAWRAEGSVLAHRENSLHACDRPSADQLQGHDDQGVELYGELASYLFLIEECGHQSVTVAVGNDGESHVQCDDCPTGWTVSGV